MDLLAGAEPRKGSWLTVALVLCRKLYVLVSVLLCLLVSGLVVFFLFPHSVLVDDNGIKVVTVWFDEKNSLVVLAITVIPKCVYILLNAAVVSWIGAKNLIGFLFLCPTL